MPIWPSPARRRRPLPPPRPTPPPPPHEGRAASARLDAPAAAPQPDGDDLRLHLPHDLPGLLLGPLPLRAGPAHPPPGRAAHGDGAGRRLLRPAHHPGGGARTRSLAPLPPGPGLHRVAGGQHGGGPLPPAPL